jgi:hypothetical protein
MEIKLRHSHWELERRNPIRIYNGDTLKLVKSFYLYGENQMIDIISNDADLIKIKEIYLYYDFPIIFFAVNETGDTFICLFAEEKTTNLRYICTKIDPEIIPELENNTIDIRTVFKNSTKFFNLLLNSQSKEPIKISETFESIISFLPEDKIYIGDLENEQKE